MFSSGKPAIGVGPGNAPVLVCADADIVAAAEGIVSSKSFDNGVICGSENNMVVVSSVADEFIRQLKERGAAVLTADEMSRFTAQVFESDSPTLKKAMVGKSARFIAEQTGICRETDIRLIVILTKHDDLQGPYGHEKLAPILSLTAGNDEVEGIELCRKILDNQGRGHTAVIYTSNRDLMRQFGLAIDASRILVNAPSAPGCVGIGTGLTPSFTLGCGTYGGNSTSDNVTYTHLLNIKRLAVHL